MPDNDVEGDKRVADAAATLRGVAREVRVVKLPGLPAKGDILDWLGAGRTVDELRALVTAEPLSGAQLLDDVIELLERYVVFPSKSQVYAVALWVMHSHAIDQADVSPYLAVTSAEKRSGKTLLLDVLELLVARPWRAVLPSEAVVYRKVAADAPTLLLDETDAIFGPKTAGNHEGLRALLNAGNRAGTTVPRVVGEGKKMKVGDFPIFCPKVIAGIGKVPDTVKDRSIPIRLQRRLRSEPVERFRRREIQEPAGLLAMAMGDIASRLDVADARPDIPAQLNDRAADGWEPLLAIADRLGGRWPARARHAAVALSAGADADEETLGVKLLDDCRGILSGQAGEGIFTATLLEQLKAIEESPWAEFDLTPRRLARLLKAYGVNPRTVRDGADTRKGYHRDELLAACERWLDPAPLSVTKPPQNVTTSQIDESEYEKSNTNGRDCDVVTDKGPFATEKGSSDAAPPGPMVQEVLRVFPGARVLS